MIIPIRTCVVTKEKLPKQDLIRIVKTKEGEILLDKTSKTNGKGAYLKNDKEVFQKARKTKVLERYLKVKIPDSLYEQLENLK